METTKEECRKSIIEVFETIGESPTASQYRNFDISPSVYTIQRVFGSWNEAKEYCNLEKRTNKKLTESEVSELIKMYKSGESMSSVAGEFDVSRRTVKHHLDYNDVDTRSISESLEGREINWANKISKSLEGRELSEETKEKIGEAHRGKESWCKGMTKQSHPDKITWGVSGEDHHAWKGGVSSEHKKIRESKEYTNWRESVFERDGYTCQKCKQIGGNLNAHHIKPFAEFENERFNTDNGVTLCRECHMNLHYGDNNE